MRLPSVVSRQAGTAGFLIYVADAGGYLSSVMVLIFRNFVGLDISWVAFLRNLSLIVPVAGLALTLAATAYFRRRLPGTV